jgi:hypothetical protein
MVTFNTNIGTINIDAGDYEYVDLFKQAIKRFNLKFPFREAHELIRELILKKQLIRRMTPEGVRYSLMQLFRVSKVHMYYAVEIKKGTPTPFAELRAYVFTNNPEGWEARLDQALKRLEWIFFSLGDSLKKNKITAEIQGLEVEQIDRDEVTAPLNQIQRYFALFGERGRIKEEYDEIGIIKIEAIRMTKYRGWVSKLSEEGKLEKKLEKKHKKLDEERL